MLVLTCRNVLLLVSNLLLATLLNAQEAEVEFHATRLGEGLYMLEGVGGFAGGNLGLSASPDGVVLIDDSMPPFEEAMMKATPARSEEKRSSPHPSDGSPPSGTPSSRLPASQQRREMVEAFESAIWQAPPVSASHSLTTIDLRNSITSSWRACGSEKKASRSGRASPPWNQMASVSVVRSPRWP